jgi:SAM-dependent methyltransferase
MQQTTIDQDTGEIIDEETALVQIEEHNTQLAQITRAVDAKAFVDQAAALSYWMRRSQVSSDVMFTATELWLRGERRLGELLTPSGSGGDRKSKSYHKILISQDDTTDEPGIDHNLRHRAQQLAAIPIPVFERKIEEFRVAGKQPTPQAVWKKTKTERKTERQEAASAKAKLFTELPEGERCQLICADITELDIESEIADVIITDPPYPQEYLPVYAELARFAARALKPGGSLLVMVGQSYLPEILALMTPHIRYHWAVAYLTSGGQSAQLWQRNVNTFWKPVLWFVNGEYAGPWVGDVTRSDVNDNDKQFHDWGQSESGMADLVERFSLPNDLIVDPFCGGGTTGVAALTLERRFIGADRDDAQITIAQARLFEVLR